MPHQPLLRPYWENRAHLTLTGDLLLYDECLVIPRSMRLEILDNIHTSRLGIMKRQARARTSVWWPGLSNRAIPPRSYFVKTAANTVRRNRSALVSIGGTAAGSKTVTSPDRPTDMVLNNEAPSVPQTPCKVSTPVPEDFSAGSSTPHGATMATPAQEIHPNTVDSPPGHSVDGNPGQPICATCSGRIVKKLQLLDL